MIPQAVNIGAPWDVLPPGLHAASLDEVKARYAYNARREKLFDGLVAGCDSLQRAGCRVVVLDGSFVSEKPEPDDFDACWHPPGVDTTKLDPELLDFDDGRKKQKQKYGGEFFPSNIPADSTSTFMDYFQKDRHTGRRKGVVVIRLGK